ncbi:MAG: DUF5666 domain-containing protein [Chloroflexota bacterium]
MTQHLLDALQASLTALESGAEVEACLAKYPDLAPQLRPLLEAALEARHLGSAAVPAEAVLRTQQAILAHGRMLRQCRPPVRKAGLQPRLAYALLALAASLILSGGWLASASAAALPGDWLYPVKRAAEDLRIRLAVSVEARQRLEADYSERRASEVLTLLQLGRTANVSFEGVLTEQVSDLWTVAGTLVRIDSATRLAGEMLPGMTVEVHGQTQPQRFVLANEVLLLEYDWTGIVEDLQSTTWRVGGLRLGVDRGTRIEGEAEVGDLVRVRVRIGSDGNLQARAIYLVSTPIAPTSTPAPSPPTPEPEQERMEFRGVVTSIAGMVWTVSGQAFLTGLETRFEDNPRVGDTVEVEAVRLLNGDLLALRIRVTEQEEDERTPEPTRTPEPEGTEEHGEEGEKVTFVGEVEAISPTIWVVAGQQLVIDDETEIRDDPAVGQTVRVEAIKQAGGVLLARRIELEDD